MGIVFWRKTKEIAPENTQSVAVTEDTPLPVTPLLNDEDDALRVQIDQTMMPPVEGVTRMVGPIKVPGIGTGAAYADGEAFGGLITFHDCFRPEKCSGTIVAVLFFDLDDEGIQKDIPFFARSITATTDNNAFAVTDADMLFWRGTLSVSTYYNWNVNQAGQNITDRLWVKSESPNLYSQIVTRGVDNIAAGAEPWIALLVVPD